MRLTEALREGDGRCTRAEWNEKAYVEGMNAGDGLWGIWATLHDPPCGPSQQVTLIDLDQTFGKQGWVLVTQE